MSGPKVVRIVTRQEIIAICHGHIAALEVAAAQWLRLGKRNDVVELDDISAVEARISAMQSLLANDEFEDLQKRAPLEIDFLKTDIDSRLQRAADQATIRRKSERSLLRSAEALALALAKNGLAVPAALANPAGQPKEGLERAISQAFANLAPSIATSELTSRQRELAAQLGAGEERLTLASWLEGQTARGEVDPAILITERRLDELRAIDPVSADLFEGRLASASVEMTSRRTLLLDSLAIDIAAARKLATETSNAKHRLEIVRARLASLGGEFAKARVNAIEYILEVESGLPALEAEISTSEAMLEAQLKAVADHQRREALLSGLAELGYDVKEGMETAWVEGGRVVLRSAKSPDYGVELGGNPENLLQVRTVALGNAGTPRERSADVKAETEFCGDFAALQANLAAAGGRLSIVKAMGIGTTPLKTVTVVDDDDEAEADIAGRKPNENARR